MKVLCFSNYNTQWLVITLLTTSSNII